MDAVPRTIGEWDPISALVSTSQKLADGYQAHGSWLLTHGELAMVIWSLAMLVIFVPLALHRFNNTVSA